MGPEPILAPLGLFLHDYWDPFICPKRPITKEMKGQRTFLLLLRNVLVNDLQWGLVQ